MPSHIVFGLNSAQRVGEIAVGLGSKAPLLMTDPVLYNLGLTQGIERALHEADLRLEVFAEVVTEPTLASVESAVETFRSRGCDLLVALGGGSSIDSAKSVSLLLGNEGPLRDYQQQRTGRDWPVKRQVQQRGAHIISMPTTAGTGSEVTAGSGVFDPATGVKGWAGHPLLRPTVAICDPRLSVSMPPRVTADTGADALSQGIECYLINGFKPTSDALALKAIEVIGQYLPKAFANGQDLEARAAMLWAATTVGLAFSNIGVLHNHSFSEVLGDITHLAHGRLLGITLPAFLDFNLVGCQEKLAHIARALGENVAAMSTRQAAECAVAAVRRLMADIDIPESLSQHGVTTEQLHMTAARVFDQHERRSAVSPRGFRSLDEVVQLLQKSM
jgi:choline dehydrogenase